ncbi:MAG: 16S rRNA (cytidine(1402)-2'-O)-methyltransferase [Acidobacteriota bacterium]
MGTLYVVATPIGNLEDITLRALRVLREVQLIAAEDTRRTAKLLQRYSIATPTTSLHEHNETRKAASLLRRLGEGASIALVSDAGTPLVSDPGGQLVRMARQEGHKVVAIPGPSAVTAILAAAGVNATEFLFLGFPPRRSNDLVRWIAEHLGTNRTVVFFEAPHRIRATLGMMREKLGDRPIIIGRELTKLHEELVEQPISAHLERLQHPRGEFTILVEGGISDGDRASVYPGDVQVCQEIGQLIENNGIQARAAVRQVASKYGLSVNEVYRLWTDSRK